MADASDVAAEESPSVWSSLSKCILNVASIETGKEYAHHAQKNIAKRIMSVFVLNKLTLKIFDARNVQC